MWLLSLPSLFMVIVFNPEEVSNATRHSHFIPINSHHKYAYSAELRVHVCVRNMAEGGDVKEKLRVAYRKINREVFEARYIGKHQMTKHRKADSTKRPVYEVISKDFEKKLESICGEVTGLKVNGKDVWKGITGPPDYDDYWLWGTEDSEHGRYGAMEKYRVMDITIKSLEYDREADYCYYVDIEVEKCLV